MTIGRTFCILVAAACLLGLGYAAGHRYPWKTVPNAPTDDKGIAAESPEAALIEAQGRLEPISGTLAVGAIPGEEIKRLDAHVGQKVRKGDVLAVLGSAELRTAERVLAERQLEKAKLQLEAEKSLAEMRQTLAGISRQQAEARKKEIPVEESINVGKQRLELAKALLGKLEELKSDPQTREAVSDAEIEQQQLLIRQISVELEANSAKRDAATETQKLAASAAELDEAMARTSRDCLTTATPIPVLEQTVELAKLAEKASIVCAPCDGTILEVYVREGERVANTPILQMGDLQQVVCVAEVHEEYLKTLDVKPAPDEADHGKLVPAREYKATMHSPALPRDLHGTVIEIGRLVGAPALRDPNPLAQTDRRTVRVRILLDKSSAESAERFVQLQVSVTIHLQRQPVDRIFMRTPLAILNLAHGKWRTIVSLGGVSLAIILVFMQLGFLGAVTGTAVQIYDQLEFDVLLRSPDYFHFCDAREIPRAYLYRVASRPEVDSVKPLHVTLATWRIPANPASTDPRKPTAGELRGIVAIGMEPSANVFNVSRLPEIEQQASQLYSSEVLLIDRKTKGDDYGAINGVAFGEGDLNKHVEVWDKRFRIVGSFELGAGLAANGSVLMSRAGYARFYPADTENLVNFGLVKLKAGVEPADFCARAKEELFGSGRSENDSAQPVVLLTRRQVLAREIWHWLVNTPIGSIFMAGVALALVVGSVVVYMVLSNDVANHLKEYATLKAMGYTDGFLRRVVMQQALVMALLGYGVSLVCAEVLYRVVGYYANLPLKMTWWICGSVLILSMAMCCASGLATLSKLSKAQPADLF